jgi:hypothetical protein
MYLFRCYVTTPMSPVPQFHGVYADTAKEARAMIRAAFVKEQLPILKLRVVKWG